MSKKLEPSAPPEDSNLNKEPTEPRVERNEFQRTASNPTQSAPPLHLGIHDANSFPNQPLQHNNGAITTTSTTTSGSDDHRKNPPPPYQEAVNYPPVYQPNNFPKPQQPNNQEFNYPPYPTHYNTMPGGGASPATNNYGAHPHPPLPQVASSTTIAVLPTGNCIHCVTGHVQSETDVCCLLCLIFLAICTFPFGLLMLCCIPCTVRRRCARCRRLNP